MSELRYLFYVTLPMKKHLRFIILLYGPMIVILFLYMSIFQKDIFRMAAPAVNPIAMAFHLLFS